MTSMTQTTFPGSAGRTAVVTGASSGIGAATARLLAAEGFHVYCAARRTDRIEALAGEIGGTAVQCDITPEASVAALARRGGGGARGPGEQAGGGVRPPPRPG